MFSTRRIKIKRTHLGSLRYLQTVLAKQVKKGLMVDVHFAVGFGVRLSGVTNANHLAVR